MVAPPPAAAPLSEADHAPLPEAALTPLPEAFCARPCLEVARDLLGRYLVRGPVALRITEVEAYLWPDDTANHGHRGRTARNAPMFGPPGRAYVYLCYGLHHLLNVVTQAEGEAAAVLIRAASPVAGLDLVRTRRRSARGVTPEGPALLAGPGRVAASLDLDLRFNHHPLFEPGELMLTAGDPSLGCRRGPRVGIDYASAADIAAPLRFAVPDTRWISHPKGLSRAPDADERASP